MSLNDLLISQNIRRALIVDDVCDSIPTVNDIGPGNDAWATFNDDLSDDHRARIIEAYPSAAQKRFDQLVADDEYIATLWNLRSELQGVCDNLFSTYMIDQQSDQRFIDLAVEKIENLGLQCETSGRNFIELIHDVDLVLIDLFFNKIQDDHSLEQSKTSLRNALDSRRDNPPLVILMSRSSRLEAKRDEFRDDVGLLDSAFRIIHKSSLEDSEYLELQIRRLAENATDSRRLATFFYNIEKGMEGATKRTLELLRKLRLSDIGQIQQLLLNAEGEPTGSYLVDIFDRVLQHEIERDSGIINAAIELNQFSTARHPSPYVAGSPELQELVERLLTQNIERLQLPGALDSPVAFGDILKITETANIENLKSALLVDLDLDNVLLVLTPACDLQRCGVPRVLLLVGTSRPLQVQDWSYKDDARTSVIRLDNVLKWIKWNVKHIDTVSYEQLSRVLDTNDLEIAARLREAHAFELQQKVLSGLGRVGTIAALPATFPVNVEVYYPNVDSLPTRLDVPALEEGAVCFVGRDENSNPVLRLIMTDHSCDSLIDILSNLEEELIAEQAKQVFRHVRESEDLSRMLTEGIDLKGATNNKWTYIKSTTSNPNFPQMGLIAWNYDQTSDSIERKLVSKAGIIILIRDAQDESPGFDTAVRSGLVQPDSQSE